MLSTETNTPAMRKRVHAAAWKNGFRKFECHFEHGQWWVTCQSGAAYSVVDCKTREGEHYFDFEQVSIGEEGNS